MVFNTFVSLVVCIRSTRGTLCSSNETTNKLIFILNFDPSTPDKGIILILAFCQNLFSRYSFKKITTISLCC